MTDKPDTVSVVEAASTLTRLGVLASRDARFLPLFEHWEERCEIIRSRENAEGASRSRAADLAWQARLKADPEFAEMLA